MSKSPSILITYPFPIASTNGGAQMTQKIAVHLAKLGCKITLVYVANQPTQKKWPRQIATHTKREREVETFLEQYSIQIVRAPPNKWHRYFDGLPVCKKVKEIIQNEKIDFVLSYYHEAAFLQKRLRKRGIPHGFIATWQSYDFTINKLHQNNLIKKLFYTWLNKIIILRPYQQADILFATSAFTKRELQQIMGVQPDRIKVCYLGVASSFHQIPRKQTKQISRIIFFARLVAHKGIEDALQALKKLLIAGHHDWEFHVFGDGRREWVKQLAKKHGIADQVFIHNAVDLTALQQALALADLALMPSHFEAFGLSNAEAQAAGLPIIAYATGSVPEVVIHGETGWLAQFQETGQLAAHLKDALENPGEVYRRGLAGRKRMAIHFTWEHTAKLILQNLQNLKAEK